MEHGGGRACLCPLCPVPQTLLLLGGRGVASRTHCFGEVPPPEILCEEPCLRGGKWVVNHKKKNLLQVISRRVAFYLSCNFSNS